MTIAVAHPSVDVLVVGGGINGAGIARDAAGRGLRVMLVEQDDLAAHTSSASTKLIHGGLRYLEFYEFGLVRKALREREILLGIAPHLIYPLRFVMPHEATLRPAWLIRAGLFLYDHLAPRRHLAASRSIDLRQHPAGQALKDEYHRGFEYSDGWVDDARLVVLNALDAHERGGQILTRTRCTAVRPLSDSLWQATLEDPRGHQTRVSARLIVNATGPWAASFHDQVAPDRSRHGLRLVKGSHIVVRRLFDHSCAYILQASDRRIIFAIPYEDEFTLIGTTDVEHSGDPRLAAIDGSEVAYLCEQTNRYFRMMITPEDVYWSYSGVRPLLEDESSDAHAVTRDYSLEWLEEPAPWLSVFGGKLTTYRTLAEEVVDGIVDRLGHGCPPWTTSIPLPGGDLPQSFDDYVSILAHRHPRVTHALVQRLVRAYGTRAEALLEQSVADDYRQVAPSVLETELRYLIEHEWARTAEDVLWRRSKLGLHLDPAATEHITSWLAQHVAA